jgi:protein involved in polysaccharide export with SLBB domain
LAKVSHPPYRVEPPDILLINATRVIPLPPYRIEPLDSLFISALETFPDEPVNGVYTVDPDGTVKLGFNYGSVRVAGLTLDEAKVAIEKQLVQSAKTSKVQQVTLADSRGKQQIAGEHLVRPDGTVGLGTYGSVHVAGKTLDEVKMAIESHLSRYLLNPEISVDVFAYNSKVYYVIFDGGGYGQQVVRLPATGNETILDAISQVNGLPITASKHKIWIARPAPAEASCDQVIPVDWCGITTGAATATNYQLFPGDRVYVQADCLIATDNFIAKVTAPIERLFGFTLLGNSVVRTLQQSGSQFNQGRSGF